MKLIRMLRKSAAFCLWNRVSSSRASVVNSLSHTHTCTHKHTHTHKHIHTHMHMHTHAHTRTHTHTHKHTRTCTNTHTSTHMQLHVYTHKSNSHSRTYVYMYNVIYTHTHTHTHISHLSSFWATLTFSSATSSSLVATARRASYESSTLLRRLEMDRNENLLPELAELLADPGVTPASSTPDGNP